MFLVSKKKKKFPVSTWLQKSVRFKIAAFLFLSDYEYINASQNVYVRQCKSEPRQLKCNFEYE